MSWKAPWTSSFEADPGLERTLNQDKGRAKKSDANMDDRMQLECKLLDGDALLQIPPPVLDVEEIDDKATAEDSRDHVSNAPEEDHNDSSQHAAGSEDETDPDIPSVFSSTLPHPDSLWSRLPEHVVEDSFGYGRIPAFWFTLNLPYNSLFDIHRFHEAVAQCKDSLFALSLIHI